MRQPYERFEYTRLEAVRAQLLLHKTFRKEEVMQDFAKPKEHYVWSFLVRPVRQADSKHN